MLDVREELYNVIPDYTVDQPGPKTITKESLLCRLCDKESEQFEVVSTRLRDYDNPKYAVVCCPKCTLTQLFPTPSFEDISKFYDNDLQAKAIWPTSDNFQKILEKKYQPDHLRRKLWIEGYLRPSNEPRVLDAGCGYGFFVNQLSQHGFNAIGIDLSKQRIKIAREKGNGTFLNGDIDANFVSKYYESFDGVTSFHVLEHLTNPVESVLSLIALVKKGGSIFIEVPNLNDELITQIPQYAYHQWQFGHMSYFNKKTLEILMDRCNIKNFEIKGVQRYGLDHLLKWSKEGKPDLSMPEDQSQNLLFDETERNYRINREKRLSCDTLILTIEK